MKIYMIEALRTAQKVMNYGNLTIDNVVKRISEESGISEEDILGKSRRESVSFLRQVSYYIYREKFNIGYEGIAHLTKRNDHTTIMHGVKKIKEGLKMYEEHLWEKVS